MNRLRDEIAAEYEMLESFEATVLEVEGITPYDIRLHHRLRYLYSLLHCIDNGWEDVAKRAWKEYIPFV